MVQTIGSGVPSGPGGVGDLFSAITITSDAKQIYPGDVVDITVDITFTANTTYMNGGVFALRFADGDYIPGEGNLSPIGIALNRITASLDQWEGDSIADLGEWIEDIDNAQWTFQVQPGNIGRVTAGGNTKFFLLVTVRDDVKTPATIPLNVLVQGRTITGIADTKTTTMNLEIEPGGGGSMTDKRVLTATKPAQWLPVGTERILCAHPVEWRQPSGTILDETGWLVESSQHNSNRIPDLSTFDFSADNPDVYAIIDDTFYLLQNFDLWLNGIIDEEFAQSEGIEVPSNEQWNNIVNQLRIFANYSIDLYVTKYGENVRNTFNSWLESDGYTLDDINDDVHGWCYNVGYTLFAIDAYLGASDATLADAIIETKAAQWIKLWRTYADNCQDKYWNLVIDPDWDECFSGLAAYMPPA